MPITLCDTCAHVKKIVSGRGSSFFLCTLHRSDARFDKYPPQPVRRCPGHAEERADGALTLRLHNDVFAVCRLDAGTALPAWATGEPLFIARTSDELSVVCGQDVVPPGVTAERDWRCLCVAGPLDFSLVGILASLTAPLAEAGLSVFAVSTYDTDYLLVRAADLARAIETLEGAGHRVAPL